MRELTKGLERKVLRIIPDLNHEDSITSGCYRQVWPFTFYGRKYVLKIDVWDDGGSGGSISEAKCWNKYKSTKYGKILTPVLAFGVLEDGRGWNVMPKLREISCVYGKGTGPDRIASGELRRNLVLEHIIFPYVKRFIPSAKWNYDRISCSQFGGDLHDENWGMDHRGRWLTWDYSEGGNDGSS
jgi:hypothetical protein